MLSKEKRVYRSHRPWKTALTIFLIVIALLIILAITVFFWFRKYIVYTDQGIVLQVPWLEEAWEADGGMPE